MITKIFKTALILTLSFSLFSCKKDKDEKSSYNEENFLDSYLAATRFDESKTNFINNVEYEFGLEFTPTVKGKITVLHVKLPDPNETFRITIWDKDSKTILRTEMFNIIKANQDYNFDIPDLELAKDKQYAITVNSNDWYTREKFDKTNATYPVSVGNITITNFIFSKGATQTYPTTHAKYYYAGDFSFDFLQMD